MYKILSGQVADITKLDDRKVARIRITSGAHKGHIANVSTQKANCGAYLVDVECDCGSIFSNGVNGCWQMGHQRKACGDPSLDVV
jgi:hypothetical protein